MKHAFPVLLILTVLLVGIGEWKLIHEASASLEREMTTEVEFTSEVIHMGEISIDSLPHAVFEIKNSGEIPLIIKAVEPSCSCTSVEWNKRPIAPGQKENINIRFEPFSPGKFSKTISVYCNTAKEVHILKFDGYTKE